MQEMIFKAARLIKYAGRWFLGLGENDSGFEVLERHFGQTLGRSRGGLSTTVHTRVDALGTLQACSSRPGKRTI